MNTKDGKGANWGGARAGAGKKAKVYSEFLKKNILDALKKKAKEEGKTFGDVLVDIVYSDEKSLINVRSQAAKIIVESLLVKESASEVAHTITRNKPTIMLPEISRPDSKEKDEDNVETPSGSTDGVLRRVAG